MSRKNSLPEKQRRRAERQAHSQELALLDFYNASKRFVHNDLGTYKVLPYPQDPEAFEALMADQIPPPETDTSTTDPEQQDELDTSSTDAN